MSEATTGADTATNDDAAIPDQLEVSAPETSFTMALSDDQRDIRDWVHGFAENVVRPAAEEWDEREETPGP